MRAAFRRYGVLLFLLLPAACMSGDLSRLAAPNAIVNKGPIGNGQILTGTVASGDTASWTFNETTGVHDIIANVSTPDPEANFIPHLAVNYPDGTVIKTTGAWPAGRLLINTGSFTQSGAYTVTVSPLHNTGLTGNFTLNLILSNFPYAVQPGAGGGTMYSGITYSGTAALTNLYQWTYAAKTGDAFSVTMTNTPGISGIIYVMNPDGTEAKSSSGVSPHVAFTAAQTGNYMIVAGNLHYTATPNSYTLTATGSSIMPDTAKSDGAFCLACALGGAACGDPINIATGNLYESVTDYTTVGTNPLALTRSYNSLSYTRNLYPTLMGANWRTNYDRYLQLASATQVAAQRADGQVVNFTLVGATWTPDTDLDYTLTNTGTTWVLTDSNDTVETYTAASGKGTLNSIRLRNGYTQTLNYTTGVLTSVSDSYSRSLGFTYTGGVLTGVTTPESLVLSYGYTTTAGQQLLTTVGYNTSPATSQIYLYENTSLPFALTGITDENGNRYATWAYDGSGRALSSQHGTGATIANLTQVAYDDATGNRTVTGPLGNVETYKFTTLQNVPKVTEIDRAANAPVAAATRTFGYDSNGYMNTATDWNGNSTTYVNNAHGDPTTINEAVGSPVARTTAIVYDTTFIHLPHTITTPGTTTTLNYDPANGNLLTKVLADTTTTTIPYSTNGQTRTWTYTWTATGQLLTAQLPRTDVVAKTTFGYTGGSLASITDALGHITHINTFTGGGRPLTIHDPNAVLTTLAYDGRLQLHTSVLTIAGGTLTTTYDHDAAEQLTKTTLPDGSFLQYGHDNAHRLDLITNALGETEVLTLDAMGNTTQTLWNNAASTTTRQHNATYDVLGDKLTDVGGMSQTTQFAYDPQSNVTGITDPLLNLSSQAFDALNRLKTFTDALTHNTVTAYDAHDRPLSVTDPNTNATTYVYDGFGEAIQQASPDSGTTVYHYDLDGNVSSKTDAASAVTNYTYDALDRILTRTYPADATLNAAFTYDEPAHGKGIGRLTDVTDTVGTLSRSYEERGLITRDTRKIGTISYITSTAYDAAGRVNLITYPNVAWKIAYTRDAAGQITGITGTQPSHTAVNIVTSATHEPFGPLNALTWGNGVTDVRTFDLDYRLSNLTDAGTGTVQNLTYGYDADNNVKTITDAVTPANSQALAYDTLNRLHTAAGAYPAETYTYDNNGNRLTDGATAYTYAPGTDRLTAVGATTIGSTATGNINAIGADTLAYNSANQLATATVAGTASVYTYDAFGQRLEAKVGTAAATVEQYDQAGNLLVETGSPKAEYVYLDGMPVATIDPVATAVISYLHTERLGTPQKATSATQAITWAPAYYQPFGTTGTITGTVKQNLRLPGQYADATKFNHNGFRDYNPGFGRYLESDPIGLLGGLNTYAYAWNNPTDNIDPDGRIVPLLVIAGVVAFVDAVEELALKLEAENDAATAYGNQITNFSGASCNQNANALTASQQNMVGAAAQTLKPAQSLINDLTK